MEVQFDLEPLVRYVKCLSVALDERDSYTQGHCSRVVALSRQLGSACGLAVDRMRVLSLSAMFHDIGKVGVPDAVLMKPGKLTADEWVVMKAHAVQGERIIRAAELDDLEQIAGVIRHHHEAFDGSGYPDGLAREAIPVMCRVLLVVDGYDAMGTGRPYHNARKHEQIMDILESEKGRKLDPDVFDAFVKVIERSSLRVH